MANNTGKKFGGRQKGTGNKTPEQIRAVIQSFIDRNFDNLQIEFEKLDAEKKLYFIEKLLKHVLPRPLNELEKLNETQLDELLKRLKNEDNE